LAVAKRAGIRIEGWVEVSFALNTMAGAEGSATTHAAKARVKRGNRLFIDKGGWVAGYLDSNPAPRFTYLGVERIIYQ
jgi:hypothetical protein